MRLFSALLLLLSPYALADRWSFSETDSGRCVISNEDLPWPLILIQVDPNQLVLWLYDPDWKSLKEDVEYEITWDLANDGGWGIDMDGVGTDSGNVGLISRFNRDEDTESFLTEFATGSNLVITYKGNELANQPLTGSMEAYFAALACAKTVDPFADSSPSDPFK